MIRDETNKQLLRIKYRLFFAFKTSEIITSEKKVYSEIHKQELPLYALDKIIYPAHKVRDIVISPETVQYVYYHYNKHFRDYAVRTLWKTEAIYLQYLINQQPEQFNELLNSGKLYPIVQRNIKKAEKAVANQVEKWIEQDRELQIAKQVSDEKTYKRLVNNLTARAEEMIFPTLLFR